MTAPVDAEITLDVACAWSYIGWVIFEAASRQYRSNGGKVEVRVVPHLLDPDAPEPGTPLLPELRAAFGEQTQPQLDRVLAAGRAVGIPFNYESAVHAGTVQAHALLHAAGRVGRTEDVLGRLFRAQFVEGLDVSDTTVLHRIAAASDSPMPTVADRDAVRTAVATAPQVGAVPVFRIGSQEAIVGTPDEQVLHRALRKAG